MTAGFCSVPESLSLTDTPQDTFRPLNTRCASLLLAPMCFTSAVKAFRDLTLRRFNLDYPQYRASSKLMLWAGREQGSL